jgi:N-acetylglucosamine kinase-like BadF-type ATPase
MNIPLEALREYMKRTDGIANSEVMREVAKEYNITLSDMNRFWRQLELPKRDLDEMNRRQR